MDRDSGADVRKTSARVEGWWRKMYCQHTIFKNYYNILFLFLGGILFDFNKKIVIYITPNKSATVTTDEVSGAYYLIKE